MLHRLTYLTPTLSLTDFTTTSTSRLRIFALSPAKHAMLEEIGPDSDGFWIPYHTENTTKTLAFSPPFAEPQTVVFCASHTALLTDGPFLENTSVLYTKDAYRDKADPLDRIQFQNGNRESQKNYAMREQLASCSD